MKNTWIPGLALLVALAGFAFSGQEEGQGGGDDAPKTQLDELSENLAKTQLEVEQLRAALVDMQAEQEQLVSWAISQAKAAAVMQSTLNASEKAGFTAGINPGSRELLLSGWRDRLSAAQSGVPEPKGPKKRLGKRLGNGPVQKRR